MTSVDRAAVGMARELTVGSEVALPEGSNDKVRARYCLLSNLDVGLNIVNGDAV